MTKRISTRRAYVALSVLTLALALTGTALAAQKKRPAGHSNANYCEREFNWCVRNCKSAHKKKGPERDACVDLCVTNRWWCDTFGPGA